MVIEFEIRKVTIQTNRLFCPLCDKSDVFVQHKMDDDNKLQHVIMGCMNCGEAKKCSVEDYNQIMSQLKIQKISEV